MFLRRYVVVVPCGGELFKFDPKTFQLLKSEQARENRRQKYFDTLRKYECSMTEENIEYLYRLKDQISTNTASSEKYDRQQENTSYYVEYYSLDKENVSDDVKERFVTENPSRFQ